MDTRTINQFLYRFSEQQQMSLCYSACGNQYCIGITPGGKSWTITLYCHCVRWYDRDDNSVPPQYVLHSISTHLPDFISTDPDRKSTAKATWWQESENFQEAMTAAAEEVLDADAARKYIWSGK
jgi:hypothetical protein